MARELSFAVLDEAAKKSEEGRWRSRDPNPTVQMSLRMPQDQYARFRALCEMERRTNGDMLGVLLEHYVRTSKD